MVTKTETKHLQYFECLNLAESFSLYKFQEVIAAVTEMKKNC